MHTDILIFWMQGATLYKKYLMDAVSHSASPSKKMFQSCWSVMGLYTYTLSLSTLEKSTIEMLTPLILFTYLHFYYIY